MEKTKKKWIKNERLIMPDTYSCPVCGREYPKPQNACPGCGTRLEGVRRRDASTDEDEIALFLEFFDD